MSRTLRSNNSEFRKEQIGLNTSVERPAFSNPPLNEATVCSVVRPTNTTGVAMGAVKFLTGMGLFTGQSDAFFTFLTNLAEAADAAQREV